MRRSEVTSSRSGREPLRGQVSQSAAFGASTAPVGGRTSPSSASSAAATIGGEGGQPGTV